MFNYSYCVFILLSVYFLAAVADKDISNSTKPDNRSSRYFPDDLENRLPGYLKKYYAASESYPQFSDNSDRYDKDNSLPYDIPSGFDQFVPDKSSGAKYNYGSFYLPYPPNVQPDHSTGESNTDKQVATTSSNSNTGISSMIKDFILKVAKFFTPADIPDSSEVEVQPSFLSSISKVFRDPMVALSLIAIPLGLILSTIVPFLSKLFMNAILPPSVVSTIANTVARGVESPEAERILEVISDFGARAMEDPKCFQRLLCQTAKAHVESRNGGFGSAQRIVQRLAKSVDDRLWDALGLKMLFSSLQNGHCDILECRGDTPSSSPRSFLNTLQKILVKVFKATEVVQ